MAVRAKYKGSLDGSAPIYKQIPVNTNQNIHAGDIAVLSSNKASIAADAASTGTVLGISATSIVTGGAVTSSDTILYDVNPNSIYRMHYIGSATPAVGNKYDMGTAAYEFDADDTTGGYIQVIGNVDTVDKFADVILLNRAFGA